MNQLLFCDQLFLVTVERFFCLDERERRVKTFGVWSQDDIAFRNLQILHFAFLILNYSPTISL